MKEEERMRHVSQPMKSCFKRKSEDIASAPDEQVKVKTEQATKQAMPKKSCFNSSRKRDNAFMNDSKGERVQCKPLKRVKTERIKSIPPSAAPKDLQLTDNAVSISHNGADNSSVIDPTSSPDVHSSQLKVEDSHSNSNTHVIFALDCSGSMKTADVRTDKGRISRWDAVFKCVDSFLDEQVQKHGLQTDACCFVSVLIFNTKSKILLNREPLGNGSDLRLALKREHEKTKPHLGTSFTAGFRQASIQAASDPKDNIVVVFLTDGRPGDLRSKPPDLGADMQPL